MDKDQKIITVIGCSGGLKTLANSFIKLQSKQFEFNFQILQETKIRKRQCGGNNSLFSKKNSSQIY